MDINVERLADQIKELCLIPSPTGYTGAIEQHLCGLFEEMGFEPVKTKKGAVRVCLGGEGNPLLLSAHVDTLGAMVRAIKSNGKLRLTKLGGYPENNIEGENCVIHTRSGKTYSGTIQLIHSSTHVYRDINTMERNDTNVEVIIDECVASKEDVQKLGISAGDIVSLDPRTVITESGFIKSRHLDDKASAAVLIELARMIKENNIQLNRRVDIFFTNYEEVGHGASTGIPEDITEMIAVDMGCVGDDLETDELVVSICAKDSNGPYDYELTSALIDVAKENELDYAVDIYPFYGSIVLHMNIFLML